MKFDDLCSLHQKKHREALGHFLVEGEHLVDELVRAARTRPELRQSELYVTHAQATPVRPFTTHVITTRQMEKLSETRSPQGIVAVVPKLTPPPPAEGERAICLYQIQDPGNLGTILRTLAWFGGFRCLLTPDSVDPYNAKAIRASMGALFHVPVEVDVALTDVQARYPRIARLDTGGESILAPSFRTFDAYLFGNEARGIPADVTRTLATCAFAIRGSGTIESLNVATAVNICAWELKRGPAP